MSNMSNMSKKVIAVFCGVAICASALVWSLYAQSTNSPAASPSVPTKETPRVISPEPPANKSGTEVKPVAASIAAPAKPTVSAKAADNKEVNAKSDAMVAPKTNTVNAVEAPAAPAERRRLGAPGSSTNRVAAPNNGMPVSTNRVDRPLRSSRGPAGMLAPAGEGTNSGGFPPGFGNLSRQARGQSSNNSVEGASDTETTAFTTMNLENADEIMPVGAWQIQNMPLDAFLDVYADLVGRTVIRPASLPTAQINFKMKSPLTRRELVQALEGVLMVNQITVIPSGQKFVTATPLADSAGMGSKINEMGLKEIPESLQFMTQIVQLTNSVPSEIVASIQPFAKIPNGIVTLDESKLIVMRDYAVNVKRMMEILKRVDVRPSDDYIFKVIPIHYGTVADINDVVGTLIGSSTTSSSSSRLNNSSSSRYGSSSSSSRYGSSSSSRTSSSLRSSRLFTSQANMQRLGSGANTFQNRMRSIMNRAGSSQQVSLLMDDAQVVPDERSNSLIVYATKRDMTVITNVVHQLDFLLPMVLIESVIVDVTLGDSLDYGVSAAQVKTNGNNFQGLGGMFNGQNTYTSAVQDAGTLTNMPSGFSYFGRVNDEWEFGVVANASKNKSTVLQRPRILTMHGVTATFFNGQRIPYASSSYYGSYSSSANVSFDYLDVGINLEVTPYITQEGYVQMEISQSIDEFLQWVEMGNDLRAPQTVNREATAMIAVKDKETIMLGGYIRQAKTKSNSGVPFLKDIPLLGYLFRSSSDSKNRSELLVFIRPTILDTPESIQSFSESESKTLPGAYMALREYNRDTCQSMLSATEEEKAMDIKEKKELLKFQERMNELDAKALKEQQKIAKRAQKKGISEKPDMELPEDFAIKQVESNIGEGNENSSSATPASSTTEKDK